MLHNNHGGQIGLFLRLQTQQGAFFFYSVHISPHCFWVYILLASQLSVKQIVHKDFLLLERWNQYHTIISPVWERLALSGLRRVGLI